MIKGCIATLFIPLWLYTLSYKVCRRQNFSLKYCLTFGLDYFTTVEYKRIFKEFRQPSYPWKNILFNYKELFKLMLDKKD